MAKIHLICFLFFSSILFAQIHNEETYKIIDKMCIDFKSNENLNDSLRFKSLHQKFISPYLKQFSDSEQEKQLDYLYIRFQKRCESFREYLQQIDPPEGENWIRLKEKPEITITTEELNEFKSTTSFYYFEYAGEKTTVETDKKYWIETFPDGTNSKLFYRWIGKSKFELEFIESDNTIRRDFSKKGEKYIYQIINKENDYYWVLVEVPGQSEILKFKLFINK